MIKIKTDSKKTIEFFKRVQRYYVQRPDLLQRSRRAWWWREGRRIYRTEGGRTGRRWRPLTAKWAEQKGSAEINVLTGRTFRALTGQQGSWYRVHRGRQQIGVNIDPKKFNTISVWRPLTSLQQQQLMASDRAEQRAIETKIDPRLPV